MMLEILAAAAMVGICINPIAVGCGPGAPRVYTLFVQAADGTVSMSPGLTKRECNVAAKMADTGTRCIWGNCAGMMQNEAPRKVECFK